MKKPAATGIATGQEKSKPQPAPPSPLPDRNQACAALPVARIRLLARNIHCLGERPLAELLLELDNGADLHRSLERYARLSPLADFIRSNGGDRLSKTRTVDGGRQ